MKFEKIEREVRPMTVGEKQMGGNGGESARVPTKICTLCHVEKPATLEFFHRAKSGKYGVKPTCKACLSEKAKARWAEKSTGKKRGAYRKNGGNRNTPTLEAPVSPVVYPVNPKDNPGRDAIIAILEKRIEKIRAAIEVIRESL
jgi:hypothetical protein